MEKLFAYALMLDTGFDIERNYEEYLHQQFLQSPEDDILLELEYISRDIDKTVSFLKEKKDFTSIDYELLTKELVELLKYCYGIMSFDDFTAKTYPLWQHLPERIAYDNPMYQLCIADDSLSWGDVQQAKEIIESMFDYYKQSFNYEEQ